MKVTTIENVKKGDYFRLIVKQKVNTGQDSYTQPKVLPTVYVADGYSRSTKKYSAYRFEDVNHFTEKKKGTKVLIDFDF